MPNRDKAALFPKFASHLIQFELELHKAGLPFYLHMGLRTWEEQDALYAQGRTLPGAKVTNAKGGDSWHNYGLAADYVMDADIAKPGVQWSWDTKGASVSLWKVMAEIAVKIGLEAGYYWKTFPDLPHVQNRYGLTLVEAKELYSQGGLQKVWEHCLLRSNQ